MCVSMTLLSGYLHAQLEIYLLVMRRVILTVDYLSGPHDVVGDSVGTLDNKE